MSSYYVTEPGFENHSLGLPGKLSIKVGIRSNRVKCDGQRYVNGRYGPSRLHLFVNKSIDFETMGKVEKDVLRELQITHRYRRQHGKKEHFIIADNEVAKERFTKHVKSLYTFYYDLYK